MAKKFVEYSGDIVTDEKDPFAKGDSGFALGTTEELNKNIGDDWWKLPLGMAIGAGGFALGKAAVDKFKSPETPSIDRTRDIPMGGPNQPVVPPAQQSRTLAEAQDMASKALANRVMNPPAPPAGAIAPQAPVQPVTPTTVTEAVATGQSPTQAIQKDIAPLVDEPIASGPEKSVPPPNEKSVQTRTRRTAEQIAAELEASLANAPEGRLPSAPNPKKSNKLLPSDVIGQGGWHWYQGQMGPEAENEWLRQFGRTNQSYADVKQAVKEGRLAGPVVPEGKKGGAFPREATVPNYIKGGAGIAPMAGMALMAPALLYAQQEAQKGNTAPIKELGFDIGGGAMLAKILGGPAALAAALGLGSRTLATGTLDSPEARAMGVKPTR